MERFIVELSSDHFFIDTTPGRSKMKMPGDEDIFGIVISRDPCSILFNVKEREHSLWLPPSYVFVPSPMYTSLMRTLRDIRDREEYREKYDKFCEALVDDKKIKIGYLYYDQKKTEFEFEPFFSS